MTLPNWLTRLIMPLLPWARPPWVKERTIHLFGWKIGFRSTPRL